jgi:5'-3' exonuclease
MFHLPFFANGRHSGAVERLSRLHEVIMTKYLIIDGNSIGHAANNGPTLVLGDFQVQAIFNFIRKLRSNVGVYGQYTPIVLWDGVSWRKQISGDYKLNRESNETKAEKLVMARKNAYLKQLPMIHKALGFLGIPQVSALNMEADDLAAILTDRYVAQGHSVILLTGDQDWLQLVGPKVVWRDPINNVTVNVSNFQEKTGVPTSKMFTEVKALSGDKGDGVVGVGGIGKKGAVDFINQYGSFDNFLNMVCLEKTVDITKLHKKFRDLVEDEAKAIMFSHNLSLVDLRTSVRPDMVGLRMNKGTPDIEKMRRFCELLLFQSITKDFDNWISTFPHFRNHMEMSNV